MLFFLVTLPTYTLSAQSTKLLLPETNATITLSFTPDKQFPNDFRTIVIHSSGMTTRLVAHDLIVRIPATRKERKDAYIWAADTPSLKIDPSRFFLVGQYTVDAKPHTLLFFISDAYASDAPPLLIIGFNDQGVPVKLLERELELADFEQTQDGAQLVGRPTIPQGLCIAANPGGPSAATYDPFSVFAIRPGSKPAYLLDASRDYNLKHYTWAGPHMSERITVIENLPGHPKFFAVPGPQADKLLAKVKCYQ